MEVQSNKFNALNRLLLQLRYNKNDGFRKFNAVN